MIQQQADFKLNDIVSYGANGVFSIQSIGELDFSQTKPNTTYLCLKPLHGHKNDCTIYMPVERAKTKLRRTMSKKEAVQLLSQLNNTHSIRLKSENRREAEYKEILQNGDYFEITRLIKTLSDRKAVRLATKKQLTQLDTKYLKIAENMMLDEMSIPLEMNKEQVEAHINQRIKPIYAEKVENT